MKFSSDHVRHEIETEEVVRYCKALPDMPNRCNYLKDSRCILFGVELKVTTPIKSSVPRIYEYHVLRCAECLENFKEE
jgi:hypothetical protein